MADHIGIITRYCQHEVTHAAIRLAEMAKADGIRPSIFGCGAVQRNVAKAWDAKILTHAQRDINTWARRCDRLIWTHVPTHYEVLQCKDHGIDTVLLVNWEELKAEDLPSVTAFDKLIIPHKCVLNAINKQWSLNSVKSVVMPWDVPVPICRKQNDVAHDVLRVHFPMYDSQPQRLDQAIFGVMYKILEANAHVSISVAAGKSWSLSSRRIIRKLRSCFNVRVSFVSCPDILQRLLLFAKADLTVWAPKFESLCLVGLTSLYMGTPVFSWDMRPQNEFLKCWKNAILVPVNTVENWCGVPSIADNYDVFISTLNSTLRDKALIAKIKNGTSDKLASRRAKFLEGWGILQQ